MKYDIVISESALKDYQKIREPFKTKIRNRIDELRESALLAKDVKALKGEFKGLFRIKINDYRIIYSKVEITITILSILHRKDIYKKK